MAKRTVRLRRKRSCPRLIEATEPRSYDRRVYARVLLAGFVVILIAAGFLVYNFAIKPGEPVAQTPFDLGSLFINGPRVVPDLSNPCIVLQEHLEATRKKTYPRAYGYLCEGLKKIVPLDQFTANARSNSLLFRDVSRYELSNFSADGSSATAGGYIIYSSGGKSRVEAAFAREGETWKISEMNMVFQ